MRNGTCVFCCSALRLKRSEPVVKAKASAFCSGWHDSVTDAKRIEGIISANRSSEAIINQPQYHQN